MDGLSVGLSHVLSNNPCSNNKFIVKARYTNFQYRNICIIDSSIIFPFEVLQKNTFYAYVCTYIYRKPESIRLNIQEWSTVNKASFMHIAVSTFKAVVTLKIFNFACVWAEKSHHKLLGAKRPLQIILSVRLDCWLAKCLSHLGAPV